jgi:steroid delta-isomerase-like uncharacterized protein
MPNAVDRPAFSQFIGMFRSSLPDIHNSVEDVVAEGDKVVVRWFGSGTHTGAALMGIPASGAQVTARGIYIMSFADGKIAEVWDNWDNLNVLQQIGGLPGPG